MNDPTELKALDEYLKRDSAISRHYRELGGGEVPPQLDRRVLEQARVAVAQERIKGSRTWLRWSAPVALAASVVLAVAVVLESGVERDALLAIKPAAQTQNAAQAGNERQTHDSPPAAEQRVTSQPLAEEAFASTPVAAARSEETLAKVRGERRGATSQVATPSAPSPHEAAEIEAVTVPPLLVDRESDAATAARSLPEPELAQSGQLAAAAPPGGLAGRQRDAPARAESDEDPGADALKDLVVTGSRVPAQQRRSAGPRGTVVPSRASSDAAAQTQEADAEPDEWLEEIRELRRDGKNRTADREWKRFRAAFPDYPVAEEDLARQRP